MPKISVIVPIYNAEKYLERCVKSLIAQTFHDIEILLIDDGSTDASSILCTRLKKEDSRIRILHKPNGGLSSARNAGLLAASGAFIGFVDADDTVSPTFFETLFQKIEQYHCDFVFCDLIRIESGKPPTLRSASLHGGYYDKRKIKRCVFPQLIMRDNLEYGPLLSVCVCLYRTSFLKEYDLRFDETVRYSEDNLFSACALFQNCPEYNFSRQLDLHLIHYACAALGGACDLPKVEQKSEIDRILNDEALKRALQNRPARHIPFKLAVQLLCMQYRCTPLMCLWLQRREHYA